MNWFRHLTCKTALLALLLSGGTAIADDDIGPGISKTPTALRNGASHVATEKAAIKELKKQLQAVWSGANLRRGTTAIHVVDADTGEALYSVHETDGLNPASNVKLISTGTVLATLGPEWKFQTRVLGAAADADGLVAGSLYLQGNYDPTLGAPALQSLANELYERGVRNIAGDIVLSDESGRDLLASARARVIVRGSAPGKPATIEMSPETDLVVVHSKKVRTRKRGRSRVRLTRRLEEKDGAATIMHLDLRGNIRKGHKRVLSAKVPSRFEFTGAVFKKALEEAGIVVTGTVRGSSVDDYTAEAGIAGHFPLPLVEHESPSIGRLVSRVNKRSLNHLADRLVMSAARSVHGGPLSMSSAVGLMKGWLTSIGVNANAVVLDTGSGLSYQTRLSTKQIVRVLRHAGGYSTAEAQTSNTRTFRDSLAISGIDGTLRGRFRNKDVSLHRRMHGKTGTLTSVIALSGFLAREDGRTICFSIVTNGHHKHHKRTVRLEHEHLVAKIDTFLDKSEAVENNESPALVITVPASAPISLPDSDIEIRACQPSTPRLPPAL